MNTIMDLCGWEVLAVVALLLVFAPVVHFLITGWATRRKEILAGFTKDGIERYFCLFFPAEPTVKNDPPAALRRFYDEQFGRQHFILAAAVLLAVSIAVTGFASWACFTWMRADAGTSFTIPAIAVAAIAGAYAWVVLDLMTRAHRGDLRPTNLFMASYRFLVAIPLAIGVASLLKETAGVPVAILLGAFPTNTLLTAIRRRTAPKIGVEHVGGPTHELEKLQGVERDEAERFEAEGVSTILQLAYADPIGLTMKTSFAFSYVVDCCSQALAWLYFEDDLAKMRRFALRGAQEISTLMGGIDGEYGEETAGRARKCLKTAAAQLQADVNVFEWVLREVAEDPYTRFLCGVWCMSFPPGTDDTDEPDDS